jgi:hypothetical protein
MCDQYLRVSRRYIAMSELQLKSPPLEGVEYVVRELGLASKWRAYDYARRGIIPCVRIGRLIRFDPRAIDALKRSGGVVEEAVAPRGEQAVARAPTAR